MPDRTIKRGNPRIRQEVAAEAARIMATEGQRSYLAAKQKAAQRLGAGRGGLPTNSEIEQALKDWQHLYGGDEHAERLRAMRLAALDAMAFLGPFQPRLVGPVLEGTADEYSRICLQLFADDPDAPVRFLMEHGIDFAQERRRIRWHGGEYRDVDVLVVEAGDQTVEMTLMIGRDAVHAPPSPIDGKPVRRIGPAELTALIEESP
ncbi:MAG: hypothetical protein ACLFSC_04395 [Wenzhouxiangella sp.]